MCVCVGNVTLVFSCFLFLLIPILAEFFPELNNSTQAPNTFNMATAAPLGMFRPLSPQLDGAVGGRHRHGTPALGTQGLWRGMLWSGRRQCTRASISTRLPPTQQAEVPGASGWWGLLLTLQLSPGSCWCPPLGFWGRRTQSKLTQAWGAQCPEHRGSTVLKMPANSFLLL